LLARDIKNVDGKEEPSGLPLRLGRLSYLYIIGLNFKFQYI
jgi:hypothetical protein